MQHFNVHLRYKKASSGQVKSREMTQNKMGNDTYGQQKARKERDIWKDKDRNEESMDVFVMPTKVSRKLPSQHDLLAANIA